MKILLDTHLLLWASVGHQRLPPKARSRIEDDATQPMFSAASIWEVAIKAGLGKADFSFDANVLRRGLLDSGYEELAISGLHAARVATLPPLHRDPFDRLLIAQAFMEGVTLLTVDRTLTAYPGDVELV